MRSLFAKRALRQRIIALFSAYAIALAGVAASLGAAQNAAEAAAQPNAVICHSSSGEAEPATGSHDSNGDICLKTCIGCIASLATVMPPTIAIAALPEVSSKRLDLPRRPVRLVEAKSNAHRSRGPPSAL